MLVYHSPEDHEWQPLRVAFCSGLSDPRTCALNSAQHQLLDRLAIADEAKLRLNFPYLARHNRQMQMPGIVRASWRNGKQFLAARARRYRLAAGEHMQKLVTRTDRLVLISLSCGMEIVNACWRDVKAPPLNVLVMAIGPVAWGQPRVRRVVLRGSLDWISASFRGPVDRVLPGIGHLGYMTYDGLPQIIDDCVQEFAQRPSTVGLASGCGRSLESG